MENISIEKKLAEEYCKLFKLIENKPDWAFTKKTADELIHTAIPFIGKKYNETKVLLYASAENLSRYDGYLEKDSDALNRRRGTYNEMHNFFPDVHIAPVADGSLLIVTAYILNILGKTLQYSTPHEFIEYIAVDNFCKFSIKSKANIDYAKDLEKIRYSLEYIKTDLELLKPEIMILPKTIYDHNEVKQLVRRIVPNCLVVPIYQINSRNINIRISKKYPKKKENTIDNLLVSWQKHPEFGLTGKTNENFYSVYTYLEDIIKHCTVIN